MVVYVTKCVAPLGRQRPQGAAAPSDEGAVKNQLFLTEGEIKSLYIYENV